jgi:hypothetical protein
LTLVNKVKKSGERKAEPGGCLMLVDNPRAPWELNGRGDFTAMTNEAVASGSRDAFEVGKV